MLVETKKTNAYERADEIVELANAFENCSWPVSLWNHQRFLIVALWFLYLNSLAEADRLLSNSLRRYCFENDLQPLPAEGFAKLKQTRLLRAMDNFIKIYKSEKSFVELANLILEHFGDEDYCAQNEDLKIDFPQIAVGRIMDLRQVARSRN